MEARNNTGFNVDPELLRQVTLRLNATQLNSKGFLKADCPFGCNHKASEDRAGIHPETGVFTCHSSKHGGKKTANVRELAEHFGLSSPGKEKSSKGQKTEYIYTDENGNPVSKVTRVEKPDGKKTFFQSGYKNGKWQTTLSGIKTTIFNLPEVLKHDTVFITEGEKACNRILTELKGKSFTATTSPQGAGKWKPEYSKHLKGKMVFILPDNDPQGKSHSIDVAKKLQGIAKTIKIINGYLPGLPAKGDIVEYFQQGGDLESLLGICNETPEATLMEMEIPEATAVNNLDPYNLEEPDVYEIIKDQVSQNYNFRYNVIRGKLEFSLANNEAWVDFSDRDLNSITMKLSKVNTGRGKKPTKDKIDTVLNSEFSKDYHPFKEYFSSLPAWDGQTDHFKQLADCVIMKPENRDTWENYFKRWLVGTVAQSTGKGKHQQALVLVGGQGKGKTTFFESLYKDKKYIFTGAIDPTSKDSLIYIAEKIIINLDELESTTKKEISEIKSLITRDFIDVRRPYDKYGLTLNRHASFCGSINGGTFLTDETGERRWLVVESEDIDLDSLGKINIDLVWSQAKAMLESGLQYWFSKDEIEKINKHNEQFKKISKEEELIQKYFEPLESENQRTKDNFYTASDIEYFLSEKKHNVKSIMIGKALGRLKHERVKLNGVYGYHLYKKTDF